MSAEFEAADRAMALMMFFFNQLRRRKSFQAVAGSFSTHPGNPGRGPDRGSLRRPIDLWSRPGRTGPAARQYFRERNAS